MQRLCGTPPRLKRSVLIADSLALADELCRAAQFQRGVEELHSKERKTVQIMPSFSYKPNLDLIRFSVSCMEIPQLCHVIMLFRKAALIRKEGVTRISESKPDRLGGYIGT